MNTRTSIVLPLVAPLLSLAACSGGSGGTTAPVPTAQINDVNAVATATIAVGTSFGVADAIGIAAGQLTVLTPGETIVYGPEAGQVVVTLDDRDGSGGISTGDACALSFETYGAMSRLFDGEAVIDSIVVQGQVSDFLPYVLTAHLRFLDMAVTHGVKVFPLAGTFDLRRELRSTVRMTEGTAQGRVAFGDSAVVAGSKFVRNEYLEPASLAWFVDATVEASGLGGTLDVQTVVPFVGVDALPAPFAGSLEASGSGGNIRIAIVNYAGGMKISVDADGNSVVEQTLDTSWDTLLNG